MEHASQLGADLHEIGDEALRRAVFIIAAAYQIEAAHGYFAGSRLQWMACGKPVIIVLVFILILIGVTPFLLKILVIIKVLILAVFFALRHGSEKPVPAHYESLFPLAVVVIDVFFKNFLICVAEAVGFLKSLLPFVFVEFALASDGGAFRGIVRLVAAYHLGEEIPHCAEVREFLCFLLILVHLPLTGGDF